MTDLYADSREAQPPLDLRPHMVAYLANNLRTNGYEHHARTMEALAKLREAGEPSDDAIINLWVGYAPDTNAPTDGVIDFARALLSRYAAPQASAEEIRNAALEEAGRVIIEKNLTRAHECLRTILALKSTAAKDGGESAKGEADVALPPLPEPRTDWALYSPTVMRDYARAAVLANRQQREDLALDDRDQLRAEIVALKGTISDMEGRQQRAGDVDERAAFALDHIAAWAGVGAGLKTHQEVRAYAKHNTEQARAALAAQPAVSDRQGGVGLLWDVYAFGKFQHRVMSPLNWDAHSVYLDMVRAGYSKDINVHLVSAANDVQPAVSAEPVELSWGLIRDHLGSEMADALCITRWKDGIDIQEPVAGLTQLIAALAAQKAGDGDALRTAVMDAIAEALGDAYDCTRVWSAWSYGTMGPDDFALIADDADRLGELADAAIAAMQQQSQEGK